MKLALSFVAVGILCLFAGTTYADTLSQLENFEKLTVAEMCSFLPKDTHFLRPNTCNNWVKCGDDGNEPEEGICAQGLYYDKESGRCQSALTVQCPFAEAAIVENRCSEQKNGVFLADLEDCNAYVLCDNEKELHGFCPQGLVFSPITGACVYKSQYDCPMAENKAMMPFCRALQSWTSIADDQDCTKYYTCEKGALATQYCDANMAYDHAAGKCVPIDEVNCFGTAALPEPENTFCLNATSGMPIVGYFRDEESCSKYYVCGEPINGKHDVDPKHLECANGQYFDVEKYSCRDRLNVKCNLDRCADVELTFVNVANDCTQYGRCKNGVTVNVSQCPADHYFDERKQVCTPQRISYAACSA